MKEPKWKIFHGAECPNCGDAVEVYSRSPIEKDTEDITWVFDGHIIKTADRERQFRFYMPLIKPLPPKP